MSIRGNCGERAAKCGQQCPGTAQGAQGDPRSVGCDGAVLAQRCQLAAAVPGVSGDGQRLHFVEREVSGQLGEPVVLQVGGFQHGHTSKRVVCKLKRKGFW